MVCWQAFDTAVNASGEEFFRSNPLAGWSVLHAGSEAGIRKCVICSSTGIYGIREQRFLFAALATGLTLGIR